MTTRPDARTAPRAKPLVHQITNYVVMNETANATLALGALPVMAHAREEVDRWRPRRRTRAQHRHALAALGRGDAVAGKPRTPRRAGRARPGRRRRDALPDGDGAAVSSTSRLTVLRGNAGEVATLVGVEAEVRGVESIGAGGDPAELARKAAAQAWRRRRGHRPRRSRLGRRPLGAVANGHPLLALDHRHRLHVDRDHGLLPRRQGPRFEAAWRRSSRSASRARTPPASRKAPALPRRAVRLARRARSGTLTAGRRRGDVDTKPLDEAARTCVRQETARRAADGGATVVQLRLKGGPTAEVVAWAARFDGLEADARSSTTTSMRRSSWAPTACISARVTRGSSGACGRDDARVSAATRREGAVAESRARPTSAPARWATRRRSSTPTAPIGLTGCATSACRRGPRRRDRRRRRVERGRMHPRGGGRGGGGGGVAEIESLRTVVDEAL